MESDTAPLGLLPSTCQEVLRETGLDELIALLCQSGDSEGLLESWLDVLEGQP
ncbi:MAG: hypothetical protein AAF183_21680 [Pseudomonadota bacterium]